MERRVVITGMGTLSPVGKDVPATWQALLAGVSGIGPITNFDPSGFRSRIAAQVKDYDPKEYFSGKDARRMDLFAQYAVAATREAVRDARLAPTDAERDRIAVLIGSGIGGIGTTTSQTLLLDRRGPARVSPFLIPMILPETAASAVAIEHGLRGPNMAVTSACATGANAIGETYRMIRHGYADAGICGGSEAGVIPISVAGFSAMRALSERNDDPEHASRPFDRDRDGFVIGEGAGILVIEARDRAIARGAHIYAEISGYATNDDAYHITAPQANGAGASACMRMAIESAGLSPEAIDYVNAHGTSTPLNDVTETRALKAVLGDHAYRIPISSTKSMTGHLLGAAGAVEAIICAKALGDGIVPPTTNLENPEPECDLDYVPDRPRKADLEHVMSNSFGFGGHNACLVFSRS